MHRYLNTDNHQVVQTFSELIGMDFFFVVTLFRPFPPDPFGSSTVERFWFFWRIPVCIPRLRIAIGAKYRDLTNGHVRSTGYLSAQHMTPTTQQICNVCTQHSNLIICAALIPTVAKRSAPKKNNRVGYHVLWWHVFRLQLSVPLAELCARLPQILVDIHNDLLRKATGELAAHVVQVDSLEQLCSALDAKSLGLAPFCGDSDCEEVIRHESAR